MRVYRLGDWPSLFGIVLVLDRLSALMLVLTSVLGLAALVFSLARWHRAGAHFHPLFQFQLMGLNGAFLTGDLFNCSCSSRSCWPPRTGWPCTAPASPASGPGCTTSRSTCRLAALPDRRQHDLRRRRHAQHGRPRRAASPALRPRTGHCWRPGAAILGVAFLVKAGMWPLGFWLPTTYAAAGTAVGRHLLDPEQGRHLRRAAAVAAAVRRGGGDFGRVRRRLAAVRRAADHRLRLDRRCLATQNMARLAGV